MKRTRRLGITLNEMVVAVTVLAVILSLCGRIFHQFVRATRHQQELFESHAALQRLAAAFRRDASTAQDVKVDEGCELTQRSGAVVEYRLEESRVRRRVLQGGKQTHQDFFRLPLHASATFRKDDKLPLVWLELTAPPSAGNPLPRQIAAAVASRSAGGQP